MPVLLEDHYGATVVLTLNRPEARNALNGALIEALGSALHRVDEDPEVRAVILTGAGDRAFCAGADLKESRLRSGEDPDYSTAGAKTYFDFHQKSISKPVIAAVNGFAVGGGFEIVLACDLVVASDQAEFGLPEVSRGLIGANGAIQLARHLTRAEAFEILLTGERITAQRAAGLGLINRVVPLGQLLEESLSLAARIADNAPLAVQAVKHLAHEAAYAARDEIPALVIEARSRVWGTDDSREGASAFVERRKPMWKGR
jgi:crotonobetainyl-CoA hydratase